MAEYSSAKLPVFPCLQRLCDPGAPGLYPKVAQSDVSLEHRRVAKAYGNAMGIAFPSFKHHQTVAAREGRLKLIA